MSWVVLLVMYIVNRSGVVNGGEQAETTEYTGLRGEMLGMLIVMLKRWGTLRDNVPRSRVVKKWSVEIEFAVSRGAGSGYEGTMVAALDASVSSS